MSCEDDVISPTLPWWRFWVAASLLGLSLSCGQEEASLPPELPSLPEEVDVLSVCPVAPPPEAAPPDSHPPREASGSRRKR